MCENKDCKCQKKDIHEKQTNWYQVKAKTFIQVMPQLCQMLRSQVDNGSRNYIQIGDDDCFQIGASNITGDVMCLLKEVGYEKVALLTGVPHNPCGLPGYPPCPKG